MPLWAHFRIRTLAVSASVFYESGAVYGAESAVFRFCAGDRTAGNTIPNRFDKQTANGNRARCNLSGFTAPFRFKIGYWETNRTFASAYRVRSVCDDPL